MHGFGARRLFRQAKMSSMAASQSQHEYPTQSSEPWTKLTHTERLQDWFAYNPRTMRPPPLSYDTKCMKILSWNVNGLGNVVNTQGFSALDLAQREDFDLLCLQETHLEEREVENFKNLAAFYDNSYWSCSVSRLGYSGTAVISRVKPITVQYGLGIHEHDQEGRIITLEFDGFYLNLEKSKPVIIAGDLNCARQSIDIHNPPAKTKSAGFTIEESHLKQTFLAGVSWILSENSTLMLWALHSGVKTSESPTKRPQSNWPYTEAIGTDETRKFNNSSEGQLCRNHILDKGSRRVEDSSSYSFFSECYGSTLICVNVFSGRPRLCVTRCGCYLWANMFTGIFTMMLLF